jgi:hypothetical protein
VRPPVPGAGVSGLIKAGKIAGYSDTTEVLRVPVGPFVYFMAIMVAVTGIASDQGDISGPPRGGSHSIRIR